MTAQRPQCYCVGSTSTIMHGHKEPEAILRDLFVFDLDDTLIDNVHDYAKPLLDACDLIIRTLGNKAPHVSKIVAMEQEIDSRRVKETNPATGKPYLYSMERFPSSLVETYREICRGSGTVANSEIEAQLYAIGMQAFDEKRYVANVNPHAADFVHLLKKCGNPLVLCTKGDMKVQSKKIKALRDAGVPLHYFDELLIVDTKDEKLFRAIKGSPDVRNFYSIGNSYQSDIAPALAAGFHGVYIPVETWETMGKMDSILAKIDPLQCTVLQNLNDAISWYRRIACEN